MEKKNIIFCTLVTLILIFLCFILTYAKIDFGLPSVIKKRVEKLDKKIEEEVLKLLLSKINNLSPYKDEAFGVAVDSTGMYVVGLDESPGKNNSQWRIEKRNLRTGDVIWSKTNNPSPYWDEAFGVAVDSTGVYVVGLDKSPGEDNSQWRIEGYTR